MQCLICKEGTYEILTESERETRMKTSISSEALLPFEASRQTDGQNICRIDAHIQEECAHNK